jgi:hypothetical protein
MPVILPELHHAAWLGETENGNLKELLVPYPADQMRMTQSHACLQPILNLSVLYCPFRVVTRNTTVEEMAGVFPLAIRDAIYRAIA